MLFHITQQSTWQAAQATGQYQSDSLEQEGFIHLSTDAQVIETAHRFYAGQLGLVLLEIDAERLDAPLRYDEVPNHGVFPHLYGVLNLNAVVQVWPFRPQADGSFIWPGSHTAISSQ